MCNACGFYCCAYGGFSGCGCENCDEPACWPDDDEFSCEDVDDEVYHVMPVRDTGDELGKILGEALSRDSSRCDEVKP